VNFLSVFKLIIPFVVGTEMALGSTVPGATKKQLVLSALTGAAGVGLTIPNPMVQEISLLIDVIATVFLKKNAPAPVVAPAAVAPVAEERVTA
jgi:hypothetical protein